MTQGKYSKYVRRDSIVFSVFDSVAAPQFQILGERHLENAPLTVGWSYLTEPLLMIPKSHKHDDYNQIIAFIGGDPYDIRNFGAEVEFSLGEEEEVQVIDSTSFVWIPPSSPAPSGSTPAPSSPPITSGRMPTWPRPASSTPRPAARPSATSTPSGPPSGPRSPRRGAISPSSG